MRQQTAQDYSESLLFIFLIFILIFIEKMWTDDTKSWKGKCVKKKSKAKKCILTADMWNS